MANIAEKLEGVIDKLDTMSSSPIPRTYGLDIASRVEHIAKQLDYVQAGGGSGGEKVIVNAAFGWDQNEQKYQNIDATYEEILGMINSGKEVIVKLGLGDTGNVSYLHLGYVSNSSIRFDYVYVNAGTDSSMPSYVHDDWVLLDSNGNITMNSTEVRT